MRDFKPLLQHAIDIEEKYRRLEVIIDARADEMIISIDDDDDEEMDGVIVVQDDHLDDTDVNEAQPVCTRCQQCNDLPNMVMCNTCREWTHLSCFEE